MSFPNNPSDAQTRIDLYAALVSKWAHRGVEVSVTFHSGHTTARLRCRTGRGAQPTAQLIYKACEMSEAKAELLLSADMEERLSRHAEARE